MLKFFILALITITTAGESVLAQSAPERIRISYSSGGMTSIDLFFAKD
jgi:hypothetical protein